MMCQPVICINSISNVGVMDRLPLDISLRNRGIESRREVRGEGSKEKELRGEEGVMER